MDYYRNQNYYDILGVEETASFENINRAKDRLKFGDSDSRVPFNLWDKIDEAYNILSDVEKRRAYDQKLREQREMSYASNVSNSVLNDENSKDNENILSDDENNKDNENVLSDDENNKDEDNEINEVKPDQEYEDIYSSSNQGSNESESSLSSNDSQENLEESKEEEKEESKEEENEQIDLSFNPIEKTPNKITKKLKPLGKYAVGAVAGIGVAGVVSGLTLAGAVGPLAGLAVGSSVMLWLKRHEKIKLHKDSKQKKISKISTEELDAIENYNKTLDQEINRLLGEPHNNYKLEINRLKYIKQVELLEKLLEIKLNKKVEKHQVLSLKMDIIATKNQLETAKKNLKRVTQKINEYRDKQSLTKINEELIEINKELTEKKDEKSFKIRKLEAYQNSKLNKRNRMAANLKMKVIRSGKIYDKFLKAKDFVVSIPYVFKNEDAIDNFIENESAKHK